MPSLIVPAADGRTNGPTDQLSPAFKCYRQYAYNLPIKWPDAKLKVRCMEPLHPRKRRGHPT